MSRAWPHNQFKDEAERRFPHKVDVSAVRDGDLTAMLDWCCAQIPGPRWACHGRVACRRKGEPPVQYARWYFIEKADAEAFRRQWLERIDGAA
jgi:hypothetical protein